VRFAARLCRRSPGFALAAILSLALAIGANTLIFNIVNRLIVAPLPVAFPEQLVFVQSSLAGSQSHSFPNYRDFRDRNRTLAGLVGYRIAPMHLDARGGATRVWGYLATGNYFEVLGVQPAAGRFFTQDDDRQPGSAAVAVLSYDTWQRRFLGDQAIVGTTIRINQLPYTVVGVAPRGFHGTEIFYRPEIRVPMMMQAQIEVGNSWLDARQSHNVWVVGRLRAGVTPAQAEADLNAIAADLRRDFPGPNRNLAVTLAQPGLVGDLLRAPVRAFTFGVFLLAGLVLLAGCTNLASILLAHGADRQREMALRVSIGAGPRRLVQQLLTESVLLSLIGGLAGAALAAVASRALSAWRAPLDFPVQLDVQADGWVLLFAIGVAMVAGVGVGLAPARQASRVDPNAALKGTDGVRLSGRRWALRDALVVLQVALCFILVFACVVALRGLQQTFTMPLGFDPRGVAVAGIDLGLAGYAEEQGRAFQQRARESLSGLPGVEAVAYANSLPLSADQSATTVSPEFEPRSATAGIRGVASYQVSPGFLRVLGVRQLAGRDFEMRDRRDAPLVAIVNETFARRVLQTTDAVGKSFRYGQSAQLVEVVGIVEDGKYTTLTEAPRPVVFQPILQRYNSTTMLVVRSRLPEEQMAGEMRRAIAALDPTLPVHGAGSLQQFLRFAWFPSRAAAIALTAFGILAVLLAATGIYGLVAYAVARREREIGIRLAVGASRFDVVRLILSRVLVAVGAGAALGSVMALATGPVLARVVYQASPRDPGVILAVFLILIAIGVGACWAPLRRSLRVDPMKAVRSE